MKGWGRCLKLPFFLDVLQLSELLAGDVKE